MRSVGGFHAREPGTRWEVDTLLVGVAFVLLVIFLSLLPEMNALRERVASTLATEFARELGYPEETGVECASLVWSKYQDSVPCVLTPPTGEGPARIKCSVLMNYCWKTN